MIHPEMDHVILSVNGKNRPRVMTVQAAQQQLQRSAGLSDTHISVYRYSPELAEYSQAHDGSIRGYEGVCFPDELIFDIDRGAHGQQIALQDARKLAYYLHDKCDVGPHQLRYFYSGLKGFHIGMPMALFGDVRPSVHMPQILLRIARNIAGDAGVEIDTGVYRRLAMIRVQRTQHPARPDAGHNYRWKIGLSWDEVVP